VSTDDADRVNEQARFAAREFVARWARETGEVLSAAVTDRMLFAYEMGFLRGRSTAAQDAMKMFDELSQARQEPSHEPRKGSNDAADATDSDEDAQ
jgi:hypothetical protein